MRILAFSDVVRWKGYERLVEKYKPHVVALAGDLTSDGCADFWHAALEAVPKYKRQIAALEKRRVQTLLQENGSTCPSQPEGSVRILHPGPESRRIEASLREVSELARRHPAYRAAREKMHVDMFYRFLRYAGKRACVLAIKGDHDDDFPGDYDPGRINRIPGCQEISGSAFERDGTTFLGVSYEETKYRRTPQALLMRFPQRGAVVISHARQRNVRLLAALQPRLVIRGHFGLGSYLLDGTPAVFTAGGHAVIDLPRGASPRIQQPSLGKERVEVQKALVRDYPWLRPYNRPE